MSEPQGPKARYKTTNWPEYNAALKARGSLTIWLDQDMPWYAPASGKRGRHHTFTDAANQFCLSIKCLFGLALRQSLGLIQSLMDLAGMDWRVPDFSTLSRRQRTRQVQLPYQRSSTALDLLVDCTASSFWAKANGNARSTGLNTGGSGARYTWALMPTRWRYGPLRYQTTVWATHPCCPSCWRRSPRMSR